MNKIKFAAAAFVIAAAPSAPALAFDWNGFYAGVGFGYSTSDVDASYENPLLSTFDFSMAPAGGFGGVAAGFNATVGSGLVVGIEADVSLADITDSAPGLVSGETVTSTTDWLASVRGRLGFDAGDFMPYVTGGVVFSHSVASASDVAEEDDAILTGAIVGAGVEVAVTDSITLKGEYLYSAFGDHTWYESQAYANTTSSSSHSVRGGINFHF
jgi:opacity protein-like surface antigen